MLGSNAADLYRPASCRNEVVEALKLTPREWEALEDRLGVPDAVSEVIMTEFDENVEDPGFTAEDVETVTELLRTGRWEKACRYSKPVVYVVLEEAILGSTYVATRSWDDATPQKIAAACNTMISLTRKLNGILPSPIPEGKIPLA